MRDRSGKPTGKYERGLAENKPDPDQHYCILHNGIAGQARPSKTHCAMMKRKCMGGDGVQRHLTSHLICA